MGPRDVVLVVVDTLRADHTSAHGYGRATTPALSRMANRGVVFRRAYAQSSWTLASFASLFTGRLPHEHRVARDDQRASHFGRLQAGMPTLADAMAAHGLSTAGFANNTFLAPEFGLHTGFQTYDYRGAAQQDHRTAAETVDKALGWLDQHPEPSFLFVHFMEPHIDYAPPKGTRGTWAVGPRPGELDPTVLEGNPFFFMQQQELTPSAPAQTWVQALYDEEVLAADLALQTLVEGLAERGRLDQTLLVLTSDHGEEFWEHGGFEHGRNLLSESTHIPLVAAGPGLSPGVVDLPVSHVDLFQGLLSAVGAPRPADTRGTSLFGLGEADAGRAVLSENCLHARGCLSLVDSAHRLVVDTHTGMGRLWTVNADLKERSMPGPQQAAQVREAMMAELMAQRGNLDELAALEGPQVPSYEAFEALSALGYIDPTDADAAEPE